MLFRSNGPNDPIRYSKALTTSVDYEGEIGVVIGKTCRDVRKADAMNHVWGFVAANDVTARDIADIEREAGNPFLGKTFDTFAPMGPYLVTKVEIADPMNLRIQTRVNGEMRQEGSTRDMIHSIPKLVSYMSQMTLMPGDIISTGSPGGGGLENPDWYLNAGDVIECEIEKIDRKSTRLNSSH